MREPIVRIHVSALRLLAAIGIVGFSVFADAQAPNGYAGPDAIPWRTYKTGQTGGVAALRNLVITNGANWNVYWKELTGELIAPKDVDFTSEQLVAIHLGQRRTGGYEVFVESIRQPSPAQITVSYVEATPPRDVMVTQMITSPWVIVRMPRVQGVVGFSKRTVVGRSGIDWGPKACRCCWRCGVDYPVVGYTLSGLSGWGGSPFDPLNNIQWRTYKTAAESNIDSFETNVIQNEAAWQRYWSRNTGDPPQNAPRNIDWVKQRVVAINLGRNAKFGTNLYVESLFRQRASELEVTYVVSAPVDIASNLKISPYAIITMDRVAGSFTFKRKDLKSRPAIESRKCGCGCKSCHFGR